MSVLDSLIGENFEWHPNSQADSTKGIIKEFALEPETPTGLWSSEKKYTRYRLFVVDQNGTRYPYQQCVITTARIP